MTGPGTAAVAIGAAAAGLAAGLIARARPRTRPLITFRLGSTFPPAVATCRHYRLAVPFCDEARCAECGPMILGPVPPSLAAARQAA